MTTLFRRRALAALGLALAGVLTFWACSSPPTIGVEVKAGPLEGRVTVTPAGEKVVEVDGPSGLCWKITFIGANGADISSSTVAVPGSVQVPTGTVRIDYDPVPCPEPRDLAVPGSGTSPLPTARALPLPSWHDVYSYPLDASSMHGAICHARVWCGANQSASEILRPVVMAGPGAAVPPNVQIRFFVDSSSSPTGATLRVAARQPILDMNLTWNDVAGFADLATGVNAVPGQLANGWFTVEFFVAESDVRMTPGSWNRAVMTFATLDQPQPEEFSLGFQVLAN